MLWITNLSMSKLISSEFTNGSIENISQSLMIISTVNKACTKIYRATNINQKLRNSIKKSEAEKKQNGSA